MSDRDVGDELRTGTKDSANHGWRWGLVTFSRDVGGRGEDVAVVGDVVCLRSGTRGVGRRSGDGRGWRLNPNHMREQGEVGARVRLCPRQMGRFFFSFLHG